LYEQLLVLSLNPRRWSRVVDYLVQLIKSIQEEPFLFLAKTPDPSVINKALLYVRDNEQTSRVLVVHFYQEEETEALAEMKKMFEDSVRIIDKIYPKIQVRCSRPWSCVSRVERRLRVGHAGSHEN
jgi:hypothetical protein